MWKARTPLLAGGLIALALFAFMRFSQTSPSETIVFSGELVVLGLYPALFLALFVALTGLFPVAMVPVATLVFVFLWGCLLAALFRFVVFDLLEFGASRRAYLARNQNKHSP